MYHRHAARIAAMTVPRVSWEDFKKQQKAAEQLEANTEADEAEKMRKYRAQLDADRAAKLAKVQSNCLKWCTVPLYRPAPSQLPGLLNQISWCLGDESCTFPGADR